MLRVFWTLRSRCPRGLTGAELTSDLGAVGAQPSCTRSRLRAGLPGGRGGGYAHGETGRAGAQLRATGGRGAGAAEPHGGHGPRLKLGRGWRRWRGPLRCRRGPLTCPPWLR